MWRGAGKGSSVLGKEYICPRGKSMSQTKVPTKRD